MSDLISRQDAIDGVHHVLYEFFDIVEDDEESPMTYNDKRLLEINKAITSLLKELSSAEPVRHGKWIISPGRTVMYCSLCGFGTWYFEGHEVIWKYCPHCGARMDIKTE